MSPQPKLGPTLSPTLGQRINLTPRMQLGIKLLPLSTVELSDRLKQELLENPLLEEMPLEDGQSSESEQAGSEMTEPGEGDAQSVDSLDDSEIDYLYGGNLDDGYRESLPKEGKERPSIENHLTTSTSLSDHLNWQVLSSTEDDATRKIALEIIGNINSDGILEASVEELAAMGQWSRVEVEEALNIVQNFDPVGVGARDLQECLLLQLRGLGLQDTPTERIVAEYLNLLKTHKEQELAKMLGLSVVEIKHHIRLIKQLNPSPGSQNSPREAQNLIPEITNKKVDDDYKAVLNDEDTPRLCISRRNQRILKQKHEGNEDARAYVKENIQKAKWLIDAVKERRKTILKVANSIIKFQRDYFDYGVAGLRPLVLREVANDIEMAESTVSRVVSNKYVATPHGVVALKFLFQGGFNNSFGESVSSATIKQLIQQIIKKENSHKPLSDSKLATILQEDGHSVKRRTIAKYREELRIPGSTQRKVV